MSRLFSVISEIAQVADTDGPSTSSPDRHERKLARQQRIERRYTAIKIQSLKAMGETIDEEKHPVEKQMETSAEILDKFLKESQEYLGNIKAANEAREIDRREVERMVMEKVVEQLEAEALEAHNLFSDIAGKWAGIQDYKDPLRIHEEILDQKMKCDELIQEKDEIIAMLKKEIKLAETKFSMDQIKQNEDISILGQRIEKQISFMKSAYNTEFKLIEHVINEEKEMYIERSDQKWEELAEKRNEEEEALSEYVFEKREEIAYNINRTTIYHEDEFRKTKIQLELDVQNAQNEFEKIKYIVLSNAERINYNYQILKQRENENITIKSQQKRRLGKLQDAITKLKNDLSTYRENTTKQIKKTSENILKMHQSILDVDSKADHFALVNEKKFNDIWNLNTKECFHLLDKISSIDKLLYEQQMGVRWYPPRHRKIDKTYMNSYHRALEMTTEYSLNLSALSKPLCDIQRMSSIEIESLNPIYNRLVKHILKTLGTKSGFLTEKCLKMLIKPYEDPEQNLVTLTNVFTSLEIKQQEDIDLMIEFFLPYCHCRICSDIGSLGSEASASISALSRHASMVSGIMSVQSTSTYNRSIAELEEACVAVHQPESFIDLIVQQVVRRESIVDDSKVVKHEFEEFSCHDDPLGEAVEVKELARRRTRNRESLQKTLCKNHHPLVLSTVYVLSALKDFVASFHHQTDISPTVGERLERKRHTISRLLEDKDIKKYWQHLGNISSCNTRVWNGLREGLLKYIEVLKDRKIASEEVIKLRKRNKDLKKLLAEYIDHGVLKPPACYVKPEISPLYSSSPSIGNK